MVESEIPFPFLNGMVVEIKVNTIPHYYSIRGQGTPFELDLSYLLDPSTVANTSQLANQSFTVSGQNAFQTGKTELKVWVSWIDNQYLTASWYLQNIGQMNLLNGVITPLTWWTSPEGTYVMPLGLINSPSPSVTVTLKNSSADQPIAGTFRVLLYDYQLNLLGTAVPKGENGLPRPYTSLDYVYTVGNQE